MFNLFPLLRQITRFYLSMLGSLVILVATACQIASATDDVRGRGVLDSFVLSSTPSGLEFTAKGWAGTGKNDSTVKSLVVKLGNEIIYEGNFIKVARPDVVTVTGRKDWDQSGWRVTAPIPRTLTNGTYDLQAQAIINDGSIVNMRVNKKIPRVTIDREPVSYDYWGGLSVGLVVGLFSVALLYGVQLTRKNSYKSAKITSLFTFVAGLPIARYSINILIITLISFFLGEAALRVFHYYRPLYIFYDDSYNRFRGRPHADARDFKLNSSGFHDVEFTKKRQHIYRIIGIGDSFAYGVVPYKYNYHTLLETQLSQQNSLVEVLNMGIPGIGPKDYLTLLVREGLKLEPDMVLLSFFIGNDFIQSNRISEERRWHSYSYVASYIHYLMTVRPRYEGRSIHGKAQYCDTCPTHLPDVFLNIEKRRSFQFIKGDERFMKSVDDAVYYMDRIQEICKKYGITFLVILIPDELQINRKLQAEIISTFSPRHAETDWDFTIPNVVLTKRLSDLGIKNLDLLPFFSGESKHQQLYKLRDTHWNIAGNQFAATVILNHINRHALIEWRSGP